MEEWTRKWKLQGLCRDYIGIIGYILGLYKDNGREHGNYYNGLYKDYYHDPCRYSRLAKDN